jgi:sodium/proline symporter
MKDSPVIAASFLGFLLLFTLVGLYSATQKKNTTTDYLLAGRGVNPWLTGLSAFATAHSGGMFISTLGYTYAVGISSAWLLVGWFLGDYLSWFFVHQRLRQVSEEVGTETIGAFLGQDTAFPGDTQVLARSSSETSSETPSETSSETPPENRAIVVVSGLITLAFLGAYAAAQLVAGSKALHVIFGWNYGFGIVLGAAVVVIYCFSGGIRASIWTDAVQAVLMVIAMMTLVIIAVGACGGFGGLWSQLEAIDPALINLVPQNLQFGFPLFLLSWLVAGVGVVGQPHIMVRAMVLDSAENMGLTRNIYALLYVLFSTAAVLVGLAARVLMPDLLEGGDPELALPLLATQMLPALMVGLILAGIFSAVISTADSQILSCSAALTQDLFPRADRSYTLAKVGTLVVTALILAIALTSGKHMFSLGVFAWSALACGLGPLLVLRAWRLPVSPVVGVTMMVVGVGTATFWNAGLQFSSSIYEVLPGMIAGALVYGVARLMGFSEQAL